MSTIVLERLSRRVVGNNVWLRTSESRDNSQLEVRDFSYEVLESEAAVGRAQFGEIKLAAENKEGDLVIILLGGRGAQALYRLLGELAETKQHGFPMLDISPDGREVLYVPDRRHESDIVLVENFK